MNNAEKDRVLMAIVDAYKLLPCPFCGGDAWKPVRANPTCHRCGVEGPLAIDDAESIRLWNTRI